MKNKTLKNAASLGAMVFTMALAASAATVTFGTDGPSTGFNGGVLNSITNTTGVAATLNYLADVNDTVNVPSNISLGNFTLACNTCTTQANGTGSTFGAFTFSLMLTDVTDGASGIFLGTSSGGTVYSDSSSINIFWSPLQLGPGASGANTGNFGTTFFQITNQTRIVDPNAGTVHGQTTVQGNVGSTATPEPATFGMLGAALLGLGMFARRKAQQV